MNILPYNYTPLNVFKYCVMVKFCFNIEDYDNVK